jgi:hypothetical protein
VRPRAPLLDQLALLPDEPSLKRQVLVGDLARLRAVYPEPEAFRAALVGVWLSDALVGAGTALWRRSFGFDLSNVQRFAGGGFHPAELLVAAGGFQPRRVREALRRRGYVNRNGVLAHGADGSIDPATDAGRLVLSSLDRVLIGRERLRAASTTALVRAAPNRSASLAADPNLGAAATALGRVTSAAIFPAEQVRPPSGVLFTPLAERSARLLAVALDDAGPGRRMIKIAVVYRSPGDARADVGVFNARLRRSTLSDDPHTRFADIVNGLHAEVVGGRAVLISGLLRNQRKRGIWRELLERGDLSVLVRPSLPG